MCARGDVRCNCGRLNAVRIRREYNVVHGRDGHQLVIRDCWWPGVLAEKATEAVLAALGHPCCGRGIGRIPRTEVFWFSVLNWPCRFAARDNEVLSLPLTPEQAAALRPDLADDPIMFPADGTDDYGYTWANGVMVGSPDDDELTA